MPNRIQVDLVADLKLALNKLGVKGTIEDAFKSAPGLTTAIAKKLGLDIQKVVAEAVSKGVQQGAQTLPEGLFARLEHKLFEGKSAILSGFGRYQVGNAFMHSIGMGGGVGGRLGGAALAGVGSKVPGLTLGLAALATAIDIATLGMRHLYEAAEQGAKLYGQARALGVSTVQTSSFLKSLGAVGIGEGTAMQLAAFGQFSRRTGRGQLSGSVAGEMVAAGQRGGMSAQEIQQIRNMSQEIDYSWRQTRVSAVESANVAKANFSIINELAILKTKLQTSLQEVAALFEPIVYGLSKTFGAFADEFNKDLGFWIRQLQKLHILPKEDRDPHHIVGFTTRATANVGSLEKMGLVIGSRNSVGQGYLKEIANNTAKIANNTSADKGSGKGAGGAGTTYYPGPKPGGVIWNVPENNSDTRATHNYTTPIHLP